MNRSLFTRPAKPLTVTVPKRDWLQRGTFAPLPSPVTVDAGSECHVTPPDVAVRMVDQVPNISACDVLEPSGGTGNLARAVLAAGGHPDRLTMVEMHNRLADGLRSIGPVENCCFLEYAARTHKRFGAVVMNPPFSRVRAHVAAAVSLLAPGGVCVALVPVTFNGEGFKTVETLPNTTFATAKVNTKVVTFTKRA